MLEFDREIIIFIQNRLSELPLWVPTLPDCVLYSFMIVMPLVLGSVYFFKKKLYFNILLLLSTPLITFLLNCIVKNIIRRPRPPYELQLSIHPHSYSFVSSHSLVTFCLYGLVVFLFFRHCKNRVINILVTIISILWIFFVGISRIWLGVHYPTDVIGAYILGMVLLFFYIKLFSKGYINE